MKPEDALVQHTVTPLELTDAFVANLTQIDAVHAVGRGDTKNGFMSAVAAGIQAEISRKEIPSGPGVSVLGIHFDH